MSQTKCTIMFPGLHKDDKMYDDIYDILKKVGYYIHGYGESKEGRYINISTEPIPKATTDLKGATMGLEGKCTVCDNQLQTNKFVFKKNIEGIAQYYCYDCINTLYIIMLEQKGSINDGR